MHVKAMHVRIGGAKRRSLWLRHADAFQETHFGQSPPLSVHIVLDHQQVGTKLIWLQNVEAFCILTCMPKNKPFAFPLTNSCFIWVPPEEGR